MISCAYFKNVDNYGYGVTRLEGCLPGVAIANVCGWPLWASWSNVHRPYYSSRTHGTEGPTTTCLIWSLHISLLIEQNLSLIASLNYTRTFREPFIQTKLLPSCYMWSERPFKSLRTHWFCLVSWGYTPFVLAKIWLIRVLHVLFARVCALPSIHIQPSLGKMAVNRQQLDGWLSRARLNSRTQGSHLWTSTLCVYLSAFDSEGEIASTHWLITSSSLYHQSLACFWVCGER